MLRVFSIAVAGLVLATGLVQADDHRGYLKAVDKDKLTVTVEDKEKGKDTEKDNEKDVVIKVDGKTQYFGGKDPISPADLTKMVKEAEDKGSRVRVLVKTKGAGPEGVAAEVRVAGKR